jgi:hypothetical protein
MGLVRTSGGIQINQSIGTNSITINGSTLPCLSWTVKQGTYGSIGSATVKTTVSLLREQGISLKSFSSASHTPLQISMGGTLVFGGIYFSSQPTFHEDEIEFTARDYASILFDSKRSLNEFKTENVTVSQLVTQIANQFNLTPNVSITNNPLVGTVMDQGAVAGGTPRQLWNFLCYLARMCNGNIWTSPNGTLNFQDLQTGSTRNYIWGSTPSSGNSTGGSLATAPLKTLTLLHQPERNKHFTVIVLGHHGQTTTVSKQTVTVAGEDITTTSTKTIKAGVYVGAAGTAVANVLSSSGIGIPTYTFESQGSKINEVQIEAESIAMRIAKKLLSCTAATSGDLTIKPLMKIAIDDSPDPGALLGYNTDNFYLSGVENSLSLDNGHITTMTGLTIPPSSSQVQGTEEGGTGS